MLDTNKVAIKNISFLKPYTKKNMFHCPNEIRTELKIIHKCVVSFVTYIPVKNQNVPHIPRKSIAIDQIWFLIFYTNLEIIIRVPPWILFKKCNKVRYHMLKLIFK